MTPRTRNPIYTPAGRAREYSPLALNLYSGCDHKCGYCYVKGMPGFAGVHDRPPVPRPDLIYALRRQLQMTEAAGGHFGRQILLSFTGDPYCQANIGLGFTGKVLGVLREFECRVAILTKGGSRALPDIDRFLNGGVAVGATLTFADDEKSLEWEPGAACPGDRLATLAILSSQGIMTWASFEPVIDPEQSLRVLSQAIPYLKAVKIGRWNHSQEASQIDWAGFGRTAVEFVRQHNVTLYVKKDLAKYLPADFLRPEETDPDRIESLFWPNPA